MSKKLIENYMEEVWNKKNFFIIQEVFSETTVIHNPLGQFKAPKEMTETVSKWITAIPDLKIDLLQTLEANGMVVSRWQAKGTHQQELNGIKATNKPVEYQRSIDVST